MRIKRILLRFLRIHWASPYSVFGLWVGILGLCAGGRGQRRDPALELHGGAASWFVKHLPGGLFVAAITFGHTQVALNAWYAL